MCWRPSWAAFPRKTACSALSCTTGSSQLRSMPSHPTHLLAGTFEVDLYSRPRPDGRPADQLSEIVKLADAEIDRLKTDGPSALEVKKSQTARESELIMGFQSVTNKASTLNQNAATLGDPLAYRSSSTGLRGHSGGREAGGRASTSVRGASSSTLFRARRRRGRRKWPWTRRRRPHSCQSAGRSRQG